MDHMYTFFPYAVPLIIKYLTYDIYKSPETVIWGLLLHPSNNTAEYTFERISLFSGYSKAYIVIQEVATFFFEVNAVVRPPYAEGA